MNKILKNLTKYVLIGTLTFSTMAMSYRPVYALPNILYDQKTSEIVTKGVTYELSHKLTEEGWLDVNVLRINLQDPNITVGPVKSGELGLKESVLNLLNSNGAIAGVNADFFGMKDTHSVSFGIAMENGDIVVASDDKNQSANDYATFFIDDNNNPFMGFLKTNFQFLNNGVENIPINAINKAGDQVYAMRFDKNGGDTTKVLDSRFQNLVKIVVENDVITYISLKGETVTVPDNGYLIVTNEEWYNERSSLFAVGQTAEFHTTSSIDLETVKVAISGGAKILENGVIAQDPGAVISGNVRQPRTAIGMSADGNELVLMVVDGRNLSIGATQQELGQLLLSYGVHNAINFDGGGSSTLVADTVNDNGLKVKNTVSDGGQRKVINGFGVFNNSTVGPMNNLEVKIDQSMVFKNTAIEVQVFGYDEYYNKIEIPFEKAAMSSTDIYGRWQGNKFYPSGLGKFEITAQYGGFAKSIPFEAMNAAEIRPDIASIGLEIGAKATIGFTGTDYEAFTAKINADGVNFEVVPKELGTVANGVFTAISNGEGYIKCTLGDASSYIPVVINSSSKQLNSFENTLESDIVFNNFPKTVQGSVGVGSEQVVDGNKALKLSYSFDVTEGYTQAAYLDFVNPIAIEGNPTALQLSVYGDNSNQWLRARVVGADGKSYVVDLAKNINWNGWSTLRATLPSGVQYPVKLDRVYVAALSNSTIDVHTLYMDNLKGIYNLASSNIKLPSRTAYIDIKKINLAGSKIKDSFDITILPSITVQEEKRPGNYAEVQQKAIEGFKKNSSLAIFAGDTNVQVPQAMVYSSNYKVDQYSNVGIVQMTAKNGGLRNTDQNQWKVFEKDLNNLDKDHIVIILDKNPLNFTDAKEKELFENIVEKVYNTGKSVFIVSAEGSSTWVTTKNGIRYINIGSLFNTNTDGSANASFKMLRLRVMGDQIQYDYK